MCVLMNEKSMYPKVANPKTETVGIYFTHGLLLYFVYFGFFTILIFIFDIKGKEEIPPKIVLPLIIFSSIWVYFGSWFIVKKLSNSKYSFLIGIK
jgi:glucan phosphoethanolaminetransferase (alkaline phosphatase superfamily)